MKKYTIQNFQKDFPNDDACLEWLRKHLYPNGIHCKRCQKKTKHHRISSRRSYSCDSCGNHVHPTAGTIFHKSRTPLTLWFYTVFVMASTRCGVSAKQIERETGVTYKTAWRMCNKIRELFEEDNDNLNGSVEVDETFFGGRRKGRVGRTMRGDKKKTPILGIVERQGRIVAKTIPDTAARTLCGIVQEHVLPRSTVYTDEFGAYNTISRIRGYNHRRIHHSSKVYVIGDIHTNTVEGFWSLIKRGIGGVYHSVSQKFLQPYLNEYTFRYNHRNDCQPMFWTLLHQIC